MAIPSLSIVSTDLLNDKAVLVELSDGTAVSITVDDILARYPNRKAPALDDPDSSDLS